MPHLRWIRHNWDKTILSLVLLFICLQNYTPGTYLIGWDNLMPELNIWLNLKRSLLAVWQEYQGLGLVGGMGHATDLIRQLLILPLTLILPNSLIRYLWHFAMLFVGAFGIYFGLKKQFSNKLIPFTSSLFYLLNFGSIQNFWVPFEPFSTFWGFFPWLIFSLLDYLKSRTLLKKLAILNILAIPSFYVPTVFIVYLICIFLILLSHFIISRKLSLKPLFLIIIINSFWFLPFLYFFFTSSQNPQLAFGNSMASQETVDRNIRRGSLSDFALLRGYYFDFPSVDGGLMAPWINHFSNSYFLAAGYLLSAFILIGLLYLLSRPKKLSLTKLSVIFLFFLSALTLLSATPPFAQINSLLRQFPLLNQVFRSPWTKFIFPAIFSFTLLFAYGLDFILKFLSQIKYSKNVLVILLTLPIILLFLFSFPVFKGNYISPNNRHSIPTEYFDLINFFRQQSSTDRILNLPQGNFYGWTNYKWKVSGSGFLWYALPQPILDRAFDVWNLSNENYYWELSQAIQQKNTFALHRILDKYSISYVIFDNNIFFPDEKIYSRNSRPSKDMLDEVPDLQLVKTFGQISVYRYRPTAPYLSSNQLLPEISYPHQINPPSAPLGEPILPASHSSLTYPKLQYISSSENFFRLQNQLSSNLLGFNFPNISFDKSYYLHIYSRHLSGHPLTLSAFDDPGHYKFLFTKINVGSSWEDSWYLIPQMSFEPFDPGLTILFDNPSFNYSDSTNDIAVVELYSTSDKLPISQYQSLSITPQKFSSSIFTYRVDLDQVLPNQTLVLPQSFSLGWLAFSDGQILPHVLVNNWANGWTLPSDIRELPSDIYIIFWPQLLEFIGLALIPITIWFTLRSPKRA